MKKILVTESNRDQAKTIVSYLKRYTDYQFILEKSDFYTGTEHYDIAIPTGATGTLKYVQKFGSIKIGSIEYTESNLVTYDKIKTLNIINSIGVPMPNTYIKKEEIEELPVFYKSLREDGYNERGIVRTNEDFEKLNLNTIFFQELIRPRGTYAVGFISDRGKMLTHFIQEEKISWPRHGGWGVVLNRLDDKRLLELTTNIIRELNYSGWGLVEYKWCDKRNDYVFMEVNGKFWASIEFALINNPLFMELLFGIKYPAKDIKSVVYIDRVANSDLSEIRKAIPYLFKSKWIKKQSVAKVIWNRFFK